MTSANAKPAPTVRVKSASVNTRDYDEAQMHKRFADICAAIHARPEEELGFNSVDVTPRSLSLLTGNLRHFVENALGRDADPQYKRITKFPHKLFMDYAPEGALDIMLCACLNFKALHGLRRLEFANLDKRQLYFDLLLRIEKNLKQSRKLPMVRVFFARTVPTSAQPALRAIVQKRGVTVSTASAATHIVYPDPEGSTAAETEGTDYCRPLEVREKLALVHWWYYPDSYDAWIPREDVDGGPDPPEDDEGPWHVQMRWLQDTEIFNEWMNEIDYEVPEEMRMKVIPAPRAEAPSAVATGNQAKAEDEKGSKKRRRMSSSSSSKLLADAAPDSRNNFAGQADKVNLASLTDDSDEETIKKPKRHSDNKDRRGKDASTTARTRKAPADGHTRKKARVSEESRGGRGENGGVKVRVFLKPPQDRSKSRARDRAKEHRASESSKPDKKDTGTDPKGMKIRVKLDKLNESETGERAPNKDSRKESDIDEVSTVKSKAPASQKVKQTEHRKESATPAEKDSGAKSDSGAAMSKSAPKQSAIEEVPTEDVGQEHKRPFSRRRSKKKERRQHNRMSGVSTVDDAVPMPEGDVPRIRNISNEGADVATNRAGSTLDKDGNSSSEVEEEAVNANGTMETEGQRVMEKTKTTTAGDENAMDIDTAPGSGRAIAISERVLSGGGSNAPVSGADVVEALPPVTVRLPAHARWFRMDAIHDIEKRSLPEFFNSRGESKTPMVYKKYRDFMIDVWRQAPEKYLTATAARRHLAGDVCAILRVHAFVEYWGLINYGTDPENKPYLSSSIRPRNGRARPLQMDSIIPDRLNGVPRLLFFDDPRPPRRENAPVSLQKAVRSAKEKTMKERNKVLSRRELYATAAATKYECDACGKDCSRMRYHCVGNADMELCPSCFANGKYPPTFSARDFEQLTTVLSSEAYDGTVWSEAEVMLLLEALEKYGDDWNQVQTHVASKSKDQCVLQFLRMPLEDSFLEDQIGNWEHGEGGENVEDSRQEGNASGEHRFAGPLLPFHDSANPVMAQVAFLASSVDPEVAAAAAQAALNKIMADSDQKAKAAAEGKTERAKALLQTKDNRQAQPALENGTRPATQPSNGSNLGTLPGSQLDGVAVEAAAAVGLAAAVARARHLLEAETRDIEREFAVAVETKMRAVDLKLKEIDRLDSHMRRERERLEKHRQQVFVERVDASIIRVGSEVQTVGRPPQGGIASSGHTQGAQQVYAAGPQNATRPPTVPSALHMQQGAVQHGPSHGLQRPVQSQYSSIPVQQGNVPVRRGAAPMLQSGLPMQQSASASQQGIPNLHGGVHSQRGGFAGSQGGLPLQQSAVTMQQDGSGIQRGAAAMQQSGAVPLHPGAAIGMEQGTGAPVQQSTGATMQQTTGVAMQQAAGVAMQQGGLGVHQNVAAMRHVAMMQHHAAVHRQQSGIAYQANQMGLQSAAVPVQPRPVALQPGPTQADAQAGSAGTQTNGVPMNTSLAPSNKQQ